MLGLSPVWVPLPRAGSDSKIRKVAVGLPTALFMQLLSTQQWLTCPKPCRPPWLRGEAGCSFTKNLHLQERPCRCMGSKRGQGRCKGPALSQQGRQPPRYGMSWKPWLLNTSDAAEHHTRGSRARGRGVGPRGLALGSDVEVVGGAARFAGWG